MEHGKIRVDVREDYPGAQWCHVRVHFPGYGAHHEGWVVVEAQAAQEHDLRAQCFRPEYAAAIKRGLEGEGDLLTLREALADLVALYAATPGHDPNFVAKGKRALEGGRR